MGSKKYQVFLSSTYLDLKEERQKAIDILLKADCIPVGMEAFVATDDEQFSVIKRVIDLCDYYILIIGMKYGTVSPSTCLSYTEMEYQYAKEKKIPILVFAIDESAELSSDKTESDPDKIKKLETFRKKAMENRLASVWKTSDDLLGSIGVSIVKAMDEIKRPGWQRAADHEGEASLRQEIIKLQKENEKLRGQLSECINFREFDEVWLKHLITSIVHFSNRDLADYFSLLCNTSHFLDELMKKEMNPDMIEEIKKQSLWIDDLIAEDMRDMDRF